MSNVPAIEIPLRWQPVVVKEEHLEWHRRKRLNEAERNRLRGPKVYQWVLRSAQGEKESVYIGETEAFENRISEYRATVEAFDDCESRGGSVRLEFLDLTDATFRINGRLVNQISLSHHDIRLMLEAIAVATAQAEGVRVLNRIRENALVRDISKYLGIGIDQAKALFDGICRGEI